MNDDITKGLASYKYGLAIKYEESRPLVKYNYVFIIYCLFCNFIYYLLFIFVTDGTNPNVGVVRYTRFQEEFNPQTLSSRIEINFKMIYRSFDRRYH